MVTLLDLGLDAAFQSSMTFVQAAIDSINAGYEDGQRIIDVGYVRSRDPWTVMSALVATSSVLHVMAHGDHSEHPSFYSTDEQTIVTLPDLALQLADEGWGGVSSGVVIADGCKTGVGVWRDAIRDCLQGPITYIGTSQLIGWHESTVYCSAFYGALTWRRGKGKTAQEQGREAAAAAAIAYKAITGRSSPYKVYDLEPSRKALKVFG